MLRPNPFLSISWILLPIVFKNILAGENQLPSCSGLSATLRGQYETPQQTLPVGSSSAVVSSHWPNKPSTYRYFDAYVQPCRRFNVRKLTSPFRIMPRHRHRHRHRLSYRLHHKLRRQRYLHWCDNHNHVNLELAVLIIIKFFKFF
jgi:hypothetical protein